MNQRATPKQKNPERPEYEKIALFVASSSNTRHIGQYHEYNSSRPDYVYLTGNATDPQLAAAANVTLP